MFKFMKVMLVLLLMVPGWAKSYDTMTTELIKSLSSQKIQVQLNGQAFSMYIPVDKVFVKDSTNLIAKPELLNQMHVLIDRYDPEVVSVIAHFTSDVSSKEQDLVREQAVLIMEGLNLKAPGRVIVSGNEPIYPNKRLEFWKNIETDKLIEVKWRSRLPVDYTVVNG